MRLFNVKSTKKVMIYGSINYRCFTIKCTPDEFEELKKTGVLIDDISVYDSFISISCTVNAKRAQDLIAKALQMGIKVKFHSEGGE